MKKIGILGGTFNPPHIGHLIIANEVRHAFELDEVRLIPTASPPHKNASDEVTAEQRLEMVALAAAEIEGITASSFEVDRGGISYTYDTIRALIASELDTEFYFIIGGDMIDMLHTWHRIEELVELVTFIGVGRPGSKNETEFPVTMVAIPEIDLSSTLIRKRFAEDGTVAFLIPSVVESFIRQEGLYGAEPIKS